MNKDYILPLVSNSFDVEEFKAVEKVFKSGFFTMGEKVKELEYEFSKYISSNYCLMVNSGSSANLLAVASLFYISDNHNRLKAGDEVIVPALSWSTTYFPLYQYGLKIRFVDICRETLNYNIEDLAEAITDKTKLIVVANILGNPNDFDEIYKCVKNREHKIWIIEDNCESIGATYKERYTGTFGDIGTFSTFFSHHISTIEGGFAVTKDEEIWNIMLSLRAHGWTRDLPDINKICTKSKDNFKEKFRFILPGYSLRPTEINAAIGIEQLKKLQTFLSNRITNSRYFIERIKEFRWMMPQKEIQHSSWFAFSIINNSNSIKRDFIISILNNSGIETRPIVAGNFINHDVVRNWISCECHGNMVNANYVDENGFYIGNHNHDIRDKIGILFDILEKSV